MIVPTRLFGEMEVAEEEIVTFASGLVGMSHLRRFVILGTGEEGPLRLMQSLEDPDVCLPVMDPAAFWPEYRVTLTAALLAPLGIRAAEEAAVLCPVSLDRSAESVTVNLQGPLVLHKQGRRGRQYILTEGQYHPRHEIPDPRPAGRSAAPVLEIKNGK